MMRIHTKAFAVSCGIVSAIVFFLKTVACALWGYGTACSSLYLELFPGYSISILGGVIGALYCFIGVAVVAASVCAIYNRLFVRM